MNEDDDYEGDEEYLDCGCLGRLLTLAGLTTLAALALILTACATPATTGAVQSHAAATNSPEGLQQALAAQAAFWGGRQ